MVKREWRCLFEESGELEVKKMKNKLLLVFFIFISVSIFADKKNEKKIVEDSKLYDAIKEINQTLKRSNKYLYILSEKDNYYPEKTYTGCPVESEIEFNHKYNHDFLISAGDGFLMKKDFINNTLIPLFENAGIHFDSVEYLYEIKEGGFETACLGFTLNKKQYVISPWIFDKDFFILHLYLNKY